MKQSQHPATTRGGEVVAVGACIIAGLCSECQKPDGSASPQDRPSGEGVPKWRGQAPPPPPTCQPSASAAGRYSIGLVKPPHQPP
jgi:hypothetical protein